LFWERSAFGFLVGDALVLLRTHGPLGPVRTALALAAALLGLLVLGLGYRRIATDQRRSIVAGQRLEIRETRPRRHDDQAATKEPR
jgi:hypothetical protein